MKGCCAIYSLKSSSWTSTRSLYATFSFLFIFFLLISSPIAFAKEVGNSANKATKTEVSEVQPTDELEEPEEAGTPLLVHLQSSNVPVNRFSSGRLGVSLISGAGVYTYNIKVPPGTHGLQPAVSISYSNQQSKTKQGILGTGWELSQDYIQRNVNFSFKNTSNDEFYLYLGGSGSKLVYDSSDGFFHTNPDNLMKIERINQSNQTGREYWAVTNVDGTTYRFGYNNDSELVSNLHNYTVIWSIDQITDSFNNSIFYNYSENPFLNDKGAVYPDSIMYNNDMLRKVQFVYETSDRTDIRTDGAYDNGNWVRYSRKLHKIQVFEENNKIREYNLNYDKLDSYSLSFLTNITEYGSNDTHLAPIKFSYRPLNISFSSGLHTGLPETMGSSEEGYRFGDFNRDGLVDMIRSQCTDNKPSDCTLANGDYFFRVWINNGTDFNLDNSWNKAVFFTLDSHNDSGGRIADVNGDGFDDMIFANAKYGNEVWINVNGTQWVNTSSWRVPLNFTNSTYVEYEDSQTRFEDVNGDNLPDLLFGDEEKAKTITYLNNGSGWYLDSTWITPRYLVRESDGLIHGDGEIRFLDLNGDGIEDAIATDVNDKWLNNGSGWTENAVVYPPSSDFWDFFLALGGSTEGDGGERFVDLDGDGLIDLTSRKDNYRTSMVFLQNGSGWEKNSTWQNPYSFAGQHGKDKGTRQIDYNGDGLADVSNGNGVLINTAAGAYQLVRIEEENGGNMTIDYRPSTQLNNTGDDKISDLGFNIWVVANITKGNGMGGDQSITTITHYNYSGGFYDYGDREFRGFAYSSEVTGNKKTEHYFKQSDSLKYKEYMTLVSDNAGTLYQKTENQWTAYNRTGGYFRVLLNETSLSSYDGSNSAPRVLNTTYQYDTFGNVNLIKYKGDVGDANDDKYEYFNYLNNSNSWIVNKAKNYSLAGPNATNKIKETLYSYDNLAYGTAPTKGALTRQEQWLSGGVNPVTNYSYDSYGNLLNVTDPNGGISQKIYGISDTTHTYVEREIDPQNNTFNYIYDLGTGNLLSRTDANNFTTNYTYDSLGRISAEIEPYDSFSLPTKAYAYEFDGIAPESVEVSYTENNGTDPNTYDEYTFTDGLGNTIQTKKEGENSRQIVTNTYYDDLGRVVKRTNPYFISTTGSYSTPDTSVPYTNFSNDPLNRVVEIVNTDNTKNNATYFHWNVTFYDENGNRLDHLMNAYGKIVEIKEYNANATYRTTYSYNAADQLTSIKDSLNNNWTYTYDTIGRKTSMFDPDTGASNYTYDKAGNLISQVAGGGNLVSGDGYYREYDNFGRLVKIRNGDTNSSQILEEYTYDPNGERIKTYNPITNTTTYTPFREFTMIVNSSGKFNYTYVYDGTDSLIARVNPDGSKYFYHDDHLGSTTLITNATQGLVESTLYLPYGSVDSGGTAEDKLYEGKILDSSGQYYFGARYYNPETALFVQPDSIIPDVYDPQQLNIYSFEINNPYNYVDPSGHSTEDYLKLSLANAASSILFKVGLAYLGHEVIFSENCKNCVGEVNPLAFFEFAPVSIIGSFSQESGLFGVEAESASSSLKVFSQGNFRSNVMSQTGEAGVGTEAHHNLPQAKEFSSKFEEAGINIHDPIYGSMVGKTEHRGTAYQYNKEFRSFFATNQQAKKEEIINFAREISERFGFNPRF